MHIHDQSAELRIAFQSRFRELLQTVDCRGRKLQGRWHGIEKAAVGIVGQLHAPGLGLRRFARGHDEDDGWIGALFQAARDLRAIQSRHMQIRHHQVRFKC